jgi:hypothetical protein
MRIEDCKDIHEDIYNAEKEYPHGNGNIIRIVSPGFGLYGDRVSGTVTLIYECECGYSEYSPNKHEHQALYGPHIIQFADSCMHCKKHKYTKHEGHEYIPIGEEILDPNKFVLYAD